MILEIIGSIIVIFGTTMIGFYYGNLETFRIKDLSEMKKALAILRSEIEYAKTPLPEALINIGMRVKKPIADMFIMLEELIHTEQNENIGDLWKECVTFYNKETYLAKEDVDNFISFGKTLGYLDKGMQLTNIEITTSYIDEKVEYLNRTRSKNRKMFQSFGVLGGLLLVIIFI